ncbi:hypothetical protein I5L81_31535 [Pseudomonas aeruginosa]|uniref:hypothetical protein n=1 Tax=Pseudomonas aeruginosa TaxID=287 RepID=UPI000BB56E0A|nr:hypothetical protein [Pseudomonas aeruginosa]EMB2840820.1 hypothetical protein [Pseudomonas aeruginosa]MBH3596428.1 hypothetical protein [Pseudomonas aeruginosa]MBH3651458.1 hypothetical protein [Pseudomonas aeruginosa]MBH3798167.1 hypothetical protein [Pseudomonas aeruginosa]PBM08843.1 hypothetical protein B8B88_25130 [Pseudomonas aeruginosa]
MPSFQIGQPDGEEFRGPDARPVTEVLDYVLSRVGRSAPVPAGSVEFHQQMALQAAQQIKQSYSHIAKEKARRECLAHLRASLRRPKEAFHANP